MERWLDGEVAPRVCGLSVQSLAFARACQFTGADWMYGLPRQGGSAARSAVGEDTRSAAVVPGIAGRGGTGT